MRFGIFAGIKIYKIRHIFFDYAESYIFSGPKICRISYQGNWTPSATPKMVSTNELLAEMMYTFTRFSIPAFLRHS